MNLYHLDGTPRPTMTKPELQELFEQVEQRLINALRDDHAAVPSLSNQGNLLWSLLHPEVFTDD